MAEAEFQEGNYDDRGKRRENFKKDVEKLLEEMEKLTVHTTWMIYNYIATRTSPELTNAMQHLEEAFLRCKEQMEKNQEG